MPRRTSIYVGNKIEVSRILKLATLPDISVTANKNDCSNKICIGNSENNNGMNVKENLMKTAHTIIHKLINLNKLNFKENFNIISKSPLKFKLY